MLDMRRRDFHTLVGGDVESRAGVKTSVPQPLIGRGVIGRQGAAEPHTVAPGAARQPRQNPARLVRRLHQRATLSTVRPREAKTPSVLAYLIALQIVGSLRPSGDIPRYNS
jgi:hypothetical protein